MPNAAMAATGSDKNINNHILGSNEPRDMTEKCNYKFLGPRDSILFFSRCSMMTGPRQKRPCGDPVDE